MKSYQQFLAELKRRHVFKVAAVYGAVAFALIQVAEPMASAMRLPETFFPFVVALLILGFPVALVLAWAFEVTPGGVHRTGEAAPGEIEAIVAEPAAKRWPSGLLALLGVAALAAGAWWAAGRTADAPGSASSGSDGPASVRLAFADGEEDPRPSVAVLPFANMSADESQEYFSDGMTEEILGALAKIDELRVAGRTSTFAYKGQQVDPRTVGEELDVRYVIDGSVRREGEDLRISAQLIDAASGTQLWSESYNRTLEGVFAIQSEIAGAVAEALRVPLGLGESADLVRSATDFEAYDLYLAARGRMRERGAAVTDAIRLYEAAIAVDSTWAPAWAGLAEATEIRLWHDENFGGQNPDTIQIREGLAAAERAARRALSLDSAHASAHVALGSVHRDRFEWEESEASYRRALALDPDNAEARQQYGELLLGMGRIAEAVVEARRSVALDPAPVRLNLLGSVLWADARQEEAEIVLRKLHAQAPERGSSVLAHLLYGQGRFDEARSVAAVLADPPWDIEEPAWSERVAWMRAGNPAAIPETVHDRLDSFDWALVGDDDRAAEERVANRYGDLEVRRLYYLWLPEFDRIRGHPLILDHLRGAGLEGATPQRTPPGERERQQRASRPGAP